jgi:large subunit ribosomal protein L3
MPTTKRPRRGSLQFYPRKRAAKFLHRVNWSPVSETNSKGLLGFIAYKVGMATAIVKDTTEKAQVQNKQVAIPVTILEAPPMKIFSVRFYKNNKVLKEIVVSNDKELKRKLKVPKQPGNLDKIPENYDNIRVIVYSISKQTSIKKTPDLIELAINADDKLQFIKDHLNKEISLEDFSKVELLDIRGLTKGKGYQGPVKRFGITLRVHKSEKGVRKVGSIGPWHPARVTFRTPMAGQLGLFSRITYNLKILDSGVIKEKDINPKAGWKNYGKIKTSYIILKGSVQGPAKRQLLITPSFRPSQKQSKKKLELMEVVIK